MAARRAPLLAYPEAVNGNVIRPPAFGLSETFRTGHRQKKVRPLAQTLLGIQPGDFNPMMNWATVCTGNPLSDLSRDQSL